MGAVLECVCKLRPYRYEGRLEGATQIFYSNLFRRLSGPLQVRGVIAGSLLEFSIEIYLQRSREFSRNKLDEGAGEGPRCICFTGWASKNSLQNVGSMNPRVAL